MTLQDIVNKECVQFMHLYDSIKAGRISNWSMDMINVSVLEERLQSIGYDSIQDAIDASSGDIKETFERVQYVITEVNRMVDNA